MDMNGEYRIPASRQIVWEALNDLEVLKASIAGCEELEQDAAGGFTAKVRAKVGPVSARFSGKVSIVDPDPPNGYRIEGEGTGGAAGFAKGGATVTLTEEAGETVLSYSANASVGGKLAQIGSRLIDGTAKKMADDFFAKFSENVLEKAPDGDEILADVRQPESVSEMGHSDAAEEPEDTPHLGKDEVEAVPTRTDVGSSTKNSIPQWVWITGVGFVIVGLLFFLA